MLRIKDKCHLTYIRESWATDKFDKVVLVSFDHIMCQSAI